MTGYRCKIKTGSHRKTVVEEQYTISRADAEAHLKALAAKPKLHIGEERIIEVLTNGFKDPKTKTMKLLIKRT